MGDEPQKVSDEFQEGYQAGQDMHAPAAAGSDEVLPYVGFLARGLGELTNLLMGVLQNPERVTDHWLGYTAAHVQLLHEALGKELQRRGR